MLIGVLTTDTVRLVEAYIIHGLHIMSRIQHTLSHEEGIPQGDNVFMQFKGVHLFFSFFFSAWLPKSVVLIRRSNSDNFGIIFLIAP